MSFGELPGHLRLTADVVEHGTEGAGVSGLEAIIAPHANVEAIVRADGMVHARRPLILGIETGGSGAELESAGGGAEQGASETAAAASGRRGGHARAGRAVIHGKKLLIERDFGGQALRYQVRQSGGLELRAGNEIQISGGRVQVVDALVVDVEEGVILPDWPVEIGLPLIEVIEGSGQARLVGEKLVGVYRPAIPVVNGISMEGIGSLFGGVDNLRARVLAVLGRVGVADDVGFGDIIRSEHQVGCAAVI